MRTLLQSALLSALVVGSVSSQTPSPGSSNGSSTIEDLCLVDYGSDLAARDSLLASGRFYGDLGRLGLVRMFEDEAQRLVGPGHQVTPLPPVFPGESVVFAARSASGIAPIHGRFLLARRAFFLTAASEDQLPESCRGSGFHGGVQVLPLTTPYLVAGDDVVPEVASLSATSFVGGPTPDPLIAQMVSEVRQPNLESHVVTLSTIQSRRANQVGYTQAVSYVTAQLAQIPGLTFQLDNFGSTFGPNIIAELPGTDLASEIVMVGAHLDSIVNTSATARSPGADDNASGSAAVLEIARILSQYQFRRTIRFGWWSAEEFGLVGSDSYSLRAQNRGDNIVAYVNTDMNSYRAPGDSLSMTYITNDSTVSLMNTLIQATNTYLPSLTVTFGPITGGTSDHRAFFRNGYPAAFPFEDANQFSPFIHSSSDDLGVSANDFAQSALITQSMIAGLACLSDPLPITPAQSSEFGTACEGSVLEPVVCPSLNEAGGTLTGATRDLEYAYRVPNAGTIQLQSFEIFTESVTGGSVAVTASVYDGSGLPNPTALATATMVVGNAPGFYSATLSSPLSLTGDFYVAIDHSGLTTVVSTLTSGDAGAGYFRDLATGDPWAASGLVQRPSFRVTCTTGSASRLSPAIDTSGVARVGRTFGLELRDALPNASAVLFVGFSDLMTAAGAPLPFPIPATGGCSLLVSPDATVDVVTDVDGRAEVSIPIPNLPSLVGIATFEQWLVVDPAANGFGLVTSNAARNQIGG